jgi:uncharacterized protein YecT (DUF1311 family)
MILSARSLKTALLSLTVLFLPALTVKAQTLYEYDDLYSQCLDRAGRINNGIVHECSSEVSEKAEIEITSRYESIYARLLSQNPDDAKKFEASQIAWLQYRNNHCDLATSYIGSPMYSYCPMILNELRALELRQLDR